MSRLGLEVGRDGGSVTVPGRLIPLGTPTVIPAGSASRAEQIQVPHPPPDPPGRGELVPRSYSSMPQFLFAHKGVTAQWGLQPRNPSLHTSATVPAPASTQSSACGGLGKKERHLEVAETCPTHAGSGKPGPAASGICLFAVELSFGEIMLKGYL